MKFVRRAFYIMTPIALLALILALLVLWAPAAARPVVAPVRAWLLRAVSSQVSNALNGSLRIGSLEGSLLSAPTIRDVVLKDAQGDVVAQLQELRLRYDLSQLLKKKLLVRDIAIVQPRVKVVQQANGSMNLSDLAPPSQPQPQEPSSGFSLPLDIELKALRIEQGQAELQLLALPGVKSVRNLNLRARGALSKAGYDFELQQLSANTQPAEVNLKTLRGALQQIGSAIHIKDVQLQTDASRIAVNGTLPGRGQPADLSIKIEPFDMADVGRLLADPTLRGLVQARISAAGPPEALNLAGKISAEGGEVALNGQLNIAADAPQYQADLEIAKLDLAALIHRDAFKSDLNMRLAARGSGIAPAALQGEAQIRIQPSTFGEIALHPSDIHITAQGKRFEIRQFHLDTSVAKVHAEGQLDLAGDSALNYDAQAQLADLRQLLGSEALDGAARLQGQASGTWPDLALRGTLTAQGLRYDANQLRDIDITYEASQLGAKLRAAAQARLQEAQLGALPVAQLDLQATYDQAASQLQVAVDVAQSADYDATLRGVLTLAGADKSIALDTLRIRLQDRAWTAPEPINVVLAANGVDIKRVHLAHDDESITASGRLDGSTFDDLRLQADNIDLDFLRAVFNLPELVSGSASLDARLAGAMEEPQVRVDAQVRAPDRPSLPFDDLRIALDYAQPQLNGRIYARQQERDVVDLNLRLPARVALNELSLDKLLVDAPMALQLRIRQPDLAALQRALPALPPLAGTLRADVDLHGAYHQLALAATVELQRLGLVGKVENIEAPIQISGEIVTAESMAALRQALAEGAVSPAIRDLKLTSPSIVGQLPSAGQAAQPWRVDNLALRAAAQLSGQAAQGLDATLHDLSLQAQAFDLPPTQLQLAAAMQGDRLEVRRLAVKSAGSELNGEGSMELQRQNVQFALAMPRVRLSDFAPGLPEHLPKEVEGTIDITGSLQAPEVAVRLRYAGARIDADVAAQLQTSIPNYQGQVSIQGLDVKPFAPVASGLINTRIQLAGEGFDAPNRRANVTLDLDSQQFALAPGLTAELRAELQGEALQLNTLYVKSEPVTLDAGGSLSSDRQAALTYLLTLGDLAPIREQLGLDVDAKGQLRGKLSGALDALSAEAILDLESWRYAAWRGKALHATVNARELTTRLQAQLEATIAAAEGPSVPPSALQLDAVYSPERGRFDVRVTEGPFQQTQIAGEAALADAQDLTLTTLNVQRGDWKWSNPKPIRIVRAANGRLEVADFELRNGQQVIMAQATLPPQGDIAGNVRIQQFHIPSNLAAFVPHAAAPDGYAQLDMQLRGALRQPSLDGVLQLSGLAWQNRHLGEVKAQLSMADNALISDVTWRDQQTDLLHVTGRVGLDAAGALDMQVQSRHFDLSRLPSYTEAVQKSAGELNLDLRVSGVMRQPEINGRLDLTHGLLQLAATGEPYKDIQTQINFAGKRITLDMFTVGSRTGTLDLKGWLELTGTRLKEMDVVVIADEFTAIRTQDIEAVLEAELNAKGSLEALAVNGEVSTPRARVRIEGLLGNGVAAVKPEELTVEGVYGGGKKTTPGEDGAEPAKPKTDALSFLQANVRVKMPRNVWVQAQGTAIELRGDLRVSKALQKPLIIAGDIQTVRGFAGYLGKKFTLDEGRITFTGTEDINPALDITANHKVSDYIVTIHVGGDAKQPEIDLSSAPEALEQADIVSLLLFGRTTDKLTESEEGSLGQKAQDAALGAAAGQAATAVGKEFGLDSVEVEVGENGRVGTGKYITQDLFLSYERLLGKEGGNVVGLEYSINRRLKLKGSSSDVGETAVDLLWRWDY